jgi:hypothetical protein
MSRSKLSILYIVFLASQLRWLYFDDSFLSILYIVEESLESDSSFSISILDLHFSGVRVCPSLNPNLNP